MGTLAGILFLAIFAYAGWRLYKYKKSQKPETGSDTSGGDNRENDNNTSHP